MKELAKFESPIGGDGGKVGGAIGIENTDLKIKLEASYPVTKITEKVVDPALSYVDDALDRLEKAIPGDWDKPHIENIKKQLREGVTKAITTGVVEAVQG